VEHAAVCLKSLLDGELQYHAKHNEHEIQRTSRGLKVCNLFQFTLCLVRLDVTVEPNHDDGYNAKYKYVKPTVLPPFNTACNALHKYQTIGRQTRAVPYQYPF
jgi:hypothetical protein